MGGPPRLTCLNVDEAEWAGVYGPLHTYTIYGHVFMTVFPLSSMCPW